MEKSLKVLLLTLALCTSASAQQIELLGMTVKCSPTEALFNHIKNVWKEEVTITGVLPNDENIVVSLWTNNSQKSATVVHTYKREGMSCVVSGIENLKYVNGV